MEPNDNDLIGEGAVSLDAERTRKFFRHLADDPFITLVVAEDGEVRVFAKDIEPDHLDRIKEVLRDLQDQGGQ